MDGVTAVSRLPGNCKIGLCTEDGNQTIPNHRVIIND
jgi:hypothetical protein